jgi:hypothetical protein
MNKLAFLGIVMSALVLTSCDIFYSAPTGEITLSKQEFAYGEPIHVDLVVEHCAIRPVEVTWTLNGEPAFGAVEDPQSFSFSLEPPTSTEYTIEALVDDGKTRITVSKTFVVKQMNFLGTWRATTVATPAYPSQTMDVVGIWRIDSFCLYYLDPNGGTQIRTYSARGTMTHPQENTWITLHEDSYWNEGTAQWEAWTGTGTMYAKYIFVGDTVHMTVAIDMSEPADVAGYSWDFIKIDDTIDAWW